MKLARGMAAAIVAVMVSGPSWADDVSPKDVVFADFSVPAALGEKAGDPAEGAKVFVSRKDGNCLACHANTAMSEELFHGNVGPSLDGVADRWSKDELRAILVDAKKVFGDQTIMPGFYSLNVGVNVREDLAGKTILSAQQVEDVVAYLATLKEE